MIFPCGQHFNVNNAQKLFTEAKMGDKKRICKHAAIDNLFRPFFFCLDEWVGDEY